MHCTFSGPPPDLPVRVTEGVSGVPVHCRVAPPHWPPAFAGAGFVSDVCSSAPRFASGFLPTPHRCDAVAIRLGVPVIESPEDFHLLVTSRFAFAPRLSDASQDRRFAPCLAHKQKRPRPRYPGSRLFKAKVISSDP